jgi:histidine ammonia-lyase
MVRFRNERMPASAALEKVGLQPLRLRSKEGLALLNGTQFMLAFGLYCLQRAEHLAEVADATAALSLDAFDARVDPFHPALHRIRPHAGQVAVAANILRWLDDSEIAAKAKVQVQDPYAFRCIPQVHGASRDAIAYARSVFETEFSSVSDNPNLFPEEDLIISGGNFHGQPLALALDFLALALSEFGSISERRIYQLISGARGLPPFLTPQPGLNSGLMIVQYTAAGIASENKRHCVPASADSIPSSNGQEDHVSMGAHAAVKCRIVAENVTTILGMEWLCASQAMEFRKEGRTSSRLATRVESFRKMVPAYSIDREMHPELVLAREFVLQFSTD